MGEEGEGEDEFAEAHGIVGSSTTATDAFLRLSGSLGIDIVIHIYLLPSCGSEFRATASEEEEQEEMRPS